MNVMNLLSATPYDSHIFFKRNTPNWSPEPWLPNKNKRFPNHSIKIGLIWTSTFFVFPSIIKCDYPCPSSIPFFRLFISTPEHQPGPERPTMRSKNERVRWRRTTWVGLLLLTVCCLTEAARLEKAKNKVSSAAGKKMSERCVVFVSFVTIRGRGILVVFGQIFFLPIRMVVLNVFAYIRGI
jgi:hypothetical protein